MEGKMIIPINFFETKKEFNYFTLINGIPFLILLAVGIVTALYCNIIVVFTVFILFFIWIFSFIIFSFIYLNSKLIIDKNGLTIIKRKKELRINLKDILFVKIIKTDVVNIHDGETFYIENAIPPILLVIHTTDGNYKILQFSKYRLRTPDYYFNKYRNCVKQLPNLVEWTSKGLYFTGKLK